MPGGNVAEEEEIARVAERVSQSLEGEQRETGEDIPEEAPEETPEEPIGEQPEEVPDEEPEEPEHWAEARKGGWKPKEEWDGDPEEWVPARAFLKNGELFDSIRTQKKQVSELRQALEDVTTLNQRLLQHQRKSSIEQKLAARREAIESGDADAVDKIDREIYETDQQFQIPKERPLPEPVQQWAETNTWFHEDPAAQQAAVAKFDQLNRQNPSDLEGNLQATTEYIYRRFPDLNPEPAPKPRKRPTAVEQPSRGRPQSRKPSVKDLTPEQRQVHDRLVRTKTMKSQEYLDGLAELGEI